MDISEEDILNAPIIFTNSASQNLNDLNEELGEFINLGYSGLDNNLDAELASSGSESNDSFCIYIEEDGVLAQDTNTTEANTLKANVVKLTEEEEKTIDACDDSNLQRLMVLNRHLHANLAGIHKKIATVLTDVRQHLSESVTELHNLKAKYSRSLVCFNYKLGAPYFKDEDYFPAPYNSDKKRRFDNEVISPYFLHEYGSKWTLKDCENLTNGVKCNYNTNRQSDICEQLNELKRKLTNEENEKKRKPIRTQITNLDKKLKMLQSTKTVEYPQLHCKKEDVNWYKVAEMFLGDKRTPEECRNFWTIYLHPKINKSDWTEAENNKLKKLATKYSAQNWERIARELKTNRSAFLTCIHYFRKLYSSIKRHERFSSAEDARLVKYVNMYKVDDYVPWARIAPYFSDRSKDQLLHRYRYYLEIGGKGEKNNRLGHFSEAESILLLVLVEKFGKNFSKCAEYMPRSHMQIKNHYNSHLERLTTSNAFTHDEDEKLWKHGQSGSKRWNAIAKELQRSRSTVRQRYQTLKHYIERYPNSRLKDVPCRSRIPNEIRTDNYEVAKYIAAQYKNVKKIPTIEQIEQAIQQKDHNNKSESIRTIDDMIMDFFVDEKPQISNVDMALKNTNIANGITESATNDIRHILTLLEANLDLDSIDTNPELDEIDRRILSQLKQFNCNEVVEKNQLLLPPSIGTVSGLCKLIEAGMNHKSIQTFQHLQGLEECVNVDEQNDVADDEEMKLFSERFKTLFYWPLILAMEKPQLNNLNIVSESQNVPEVVNRKRLRTDENRRISTKPSEKKIRIEVPQDEDTTLLDIQKLNAFIESV